MKMWGDQNNEGRGEEAEEKGLKKVKGLPEPKDSSESLNDTHAYNWGEKIKHIFERRERMDLSCFSFARLLLFKETGK